VGWEEDLGHGFTEHHSKAKKGSEGVRGKKKIFRKDWHGKDGQ